MKIKVMSFNIQHCRDYVKRVIDVNLMTNTIKKFSPEIIGLNEVYGKYEDNLPQTQIIGEELGFYHFFGQSITFKGIPYGNGFLSKVKPDNIKIVKIPDPIPDDDGPYESRTIIKADFEKFAVLVSHFGLMTSEQKNAVETTVNLIKNINKPVILMGDFNMESSDPSIAPFYTLLKDSLTKEVFSYPSINPQKRIDYIFVSKDIKVIDANIEPIIASDHFPHTAILKLPNN